MRDTMTTESSNSADLESCINVGYESSIIININSSNDLEDVGTSFVLSGSEESTSTEKKDVIPEEENQDDDDQDQDQCPSSLEKPDSTPGASFLETDKFDRDIPEASGASRGFYRYRDFSNVPEKDIENEIDVTPNPGTGPRQSRAYAARSQKFPLKLYAILARKEFQEIISWMPHGRSWKVLKPNLFESFVMPIFFEYSNYHSFNRLVNAWSFRRITVGIDRGSYYHELFLRGKPNLQKYMRRLPKTHKKSPMKKEDEPNFYVMDKEKPLPQCCGNTNHFVNLYPTPFGMASGAMPMLIPIPMQMPMPIPLQPRYHTMAGVSGLAFDGMNNTHGMRETSFICGADNMVSQNMHSIGMPLASSSSFSSTGPSTGEINDMSGIMGSADMCTNGIGEGIETGMNLNQMNAIDGEDMGMGSSVASQGAFDIEDPITKDEPIDLVHRDCCN